MEQIIHLRHRMETVGSVTSSRDRSLPFETAASMIQQLLGCDDFEDIATLKVIRVRSRDTIRNM